MHFFLEKQKRKCLNREGALQLSTTVLPQRKTRLAPSAGSCSPIFSTVLLSTVARLTLFNQMVSDFPFHDKVKVALPLLMGKGF